jgi:predicted hydrocarbon binding protein
MLGIILRELKKYVEAGHGKPVWQEVLRLAGVEGKVYLPLIEYPDAELVTLVTHAANRSGQPVETVLVEFGQFMVPDLFQTYRSLIQPGWTTLDLIEHTEKVIHSAVRLRDTSARPPELSVVRTSSDSVEITYRSHRKLCAVAKGIARGVAKQYGEQVEVTESSCMHDGAPECLIRVVCVK